MRLFNRTTRSVSLTDAGRVFVDQVGPALQDIHDAMEACGRSRRRRPARCASTPSPPRREKSCRRWCWNSCGAIRRCMSISSPKGRLVDIVAEGFDLGVRRADLVPTDMIAISLGRPQRSPSWRAGVFREAWPAADPARPPRPPVHPCPAAERRALSLAVRESRPAGADRRERTDHPGRGQPRTDSRARWHRAWLLLRTGCAADIEAGRLVRVLEEWTPPLPGLCLYYPGRRNPSAALKALVSLARERGATRDVPPGRIAAAATRPRQRPKT